MTLTVLVAGALANKPGNGGEAWVRLSWVRGLQGLGIDVHFVEEISSAACVRADGTATAFETSENLAWFRRMVSAAGIAGQATLVCAAEDAVRTDGLPLEDLVAVAAGADLLVNISGNLALPGVFTRPRRRVYVDIDPGFTQLWHAAGVAGARLEGHDDFFTIGERIGTAGCPIPTRDIPWRPVRQPVVLDDWPVVSGDRNTFTTVASWRGPFGPVGHDGRTYGLKVHEFRKLATLPRLVDQTLELALAIHPEETADLALLADNGWRLVGPSDVAGDPWSFRDYVQRSGGEFSVAQGVYVETNSGWFSDRTTRYLASGKPVLVQDTGFADDLEPGCGLVAFRNLDEARAGAAAIHDDYDAHAVAARGLAERCFASDIVLGRFIDDLGLAP